MELLKTVFALNTDPLEIPDWVPPILEFANRILVLFKDLGLDYLPELSSVTLSLFIILTQLELEHDQMSMLKLLLHLLNWKHDTGMPALAFISFPAVLIISLARQ